MPLEFASRLNNVETSAIRELFKLLGKPGIISFAGAFPVAAMSEAAALPRTDKPAPPRPPGGILQCAPTEGYAPPREQRRLFRAGRGVAVAPDGLTVPPGAEQSLDRK